MRTPRALPRIGPPRRLGGLRWLPAVLVLLPWLLGPRAPAEDVRMRDLSSTVSFRLLDWETVNVAARAGPLWQGLTGHDGVTAADADTLRSYFRSTGQARQQARPAAEAALERVVGQAYTEAGIPRSQPVPLPYLFPPVLVALTPPPNVLVISPRTAIRVADSLILNPLDIPAAERLEASADSTGVSSLVAPIGGLATYPSMVLDQGTPDQVLAAAAHEWMHQYLIFYPLGAHYWDSDETRDINETTAEMIGQEVGSQLAKRLDLEPPPAPAPPQPGTSSFDFRAFMRQTRLRTEQLLAAGQVDQAEAYMNRRRDQLQQHGYYIRKLNQAYFALYGSYGQSDAASPTNPIADLLQRLRQHSGSLSAFIFRVREITTIAELRQAAG